MTIWVSPAYHIGFEGFGGYVSLQLLPQYLFSFIISKLVDTNLSNPHTQGHHSMYTQFCL